jgi:subtilisin-like proprotein convertase family protein
VGIHHPSLDEKAITFNTDPLEKSDNCIGGGTDTHWHIDQHEDGTTEPGSSGSGLWDSSNHCFIGTLSGGAASCSVIDYDCYGRFAKHWTGGGTAATRLSDWLDPAGTNPTGCVTGSYARGSLALASTATADSCGLGAGDNNGIEEPGETIELRVSLTATGSGDFTGVTGTLIALSPGVTILDGSVDWPDFPAGTTRLSNAPHLTVLLDGSVTCFAPVDLRLDVVSNEGGPFQLPITLDVGGPVVSDAPQRIPDPGTRTSVMVVAQALTISALRVHVNIEHSWVGDLLVELEAPSGTRITLLDRPGIPPVGNGCGDDDMDVVFDDASGVNPEARCAGSTPWLSGTARPVTPLSAFDGQSTAGTWRLFVTDAGSPDFGTILDWDLVTRPPLDETCTPCAPAENCANGIDDDGDGKIDCADSDCSGSPSCVEACGDLIDNDADGLTDCADPDCFNDPINCPPPPELDCTNGLDDDGDTAVDCADSDCAARPPCLPENCANGIDDDGDGLTDCSDPDCLADPACAGFDFDGDGHPNAADCAPEDDQLWATPAEVPRDLRVTKAAGAGQIAWSSLATQAGPSTRYDVVSGEIGQVRGDRSIMRATCHNDSVPATATSDARMLGRAGDGYYYLARGQNACVPGTGSYGSGSPSAPPRVPTVGCP